MAMMHDYSFDYLRAVSAVMIVVCHICQGFGLNPELGFYLGATFVSVFLILSAYLWGLRHRDGIFESPTGFLVSRLGKLCPTYYIFLTISFLLISFFIGVWNMSPMEVLGHFLFLNWFVTSTRIDSAPLPHMGHLWFMSCIIMAYSIITVMAYCFIFRNKSIGFWSSYLFLALLAGSSLCAVSRIFIYPSVVLTLFPPFFFKGKELIELTHKVSRKYLIKLFVIINVVTITAFQFGLRNNPVLVYISITITAFLWIVCTPLIFNRERIPSWIAFISAISFEMYLIHHPFCLGTYSLSKYFPTWLSIPMVFAISIVGGYSLNRLVAIYFVAIQRLKSNGGKC